MKKILVSIALASSVLLPQLSAAEHNFIMDIMPLGVTAHSDINGFKNKSGYSYEAISGSASVSPNILLGYGLDLDYFSMDAEVGGGLLVNGAFSAAYLQGEMTAYVTSFQKGFMIGPFYRYMNIEDPTWGTKNLEMTGTVASAFGLAMMTGGKHVKFKMKVSQLNDANIAVKGVNGYRPSQDTLSLDGISLELGLALRF